MLGSQGCFTSLLSHYNEPRAVPKLSITPVLLNSLGETVDSHTITDIHINLLNLCLSQSYQSIHHSQERSSHWGHKVVSPLCRRTITSRGLSLNCQSLQFF